MATLVVVNGKRIEVQEALRQAILYNEEQLIERAIRMLLVEQYAKDNDIVNTDEELQLAADELRYQNELENVDKLNQWIQGRHLTLMSIQRGIDGHLLKNKVIQAIPKEAIQAFFTEHRLALDWIELYSIRLSSKALAEELYFQITEENANFHVLAMEHSLDLETKKLGGYIGKLKRAQISGEIEAAVFRVSLDKSWAPSKRKKVTIFLKLREWEKSHLRVKKSILDLFYLISLLINSELKPRLNILCLIDPSVKNNQPLSLAWNC